MRTGLIVSGIFLAVMIVGFMIMHRANTDDDEKGPGVIRAVVGVGDAVVLPESVFHKDDPDYETHRLTVIGIADGRVRARAIVGKNRRMACGPSVAGRIWCADEKTVELRDAATLAVVTDHARIVGALGAELADWSPWIDLANGEVLVRTIDGRDVAVDATMNAHPFTRLAADDRYLVLEYRNPRSSTKKPESGGIVATLTGQPPVLVGTDTKSHRDVWRYDGSIAK